MDTSTYHLDQNVRGMVSKGLIDKKFLDKYHHEKYEAILPFALLEYAGIEGFKRLIKEIVIPQSLVDENPIELYKIKEHLENELKSKLPKKHIEERLKERLQRDNNYAKPFAQGCIDILPKIYDSQIIPQLSWDRFSQMKWSEHILKKGLLSGIRREIAKLLSKEDLYILRHAYYLSQIPYNINDESNDTCEYIDKMKKVKLESNMDTGDCELIHIAINGQASSDFKKRRTVDCYTMDPAEEIENRLTLCLFYYEILECESSIRYTFDPKYCGKIYILDENGHEIKIINVKDHLPKKMLYKIIYKNNYKQRGHRCQF